MNDSFCHCFSLTQYLESGRDQIFTDHLMNVIYEITLYIYFHSCMIHLIGKFSVLPKLNKQA